MPGSVDEPHDRVEGKGLDVGDFTDSFEMDMGYVDAFRLWGMSAFDDREHLQRYLDATAMPAR